MAEVPEAPKRRERDITRRRPQTRRPRPAQTTSESSVTKEEK